MTNDLNRNTRTMIVSLVVAIFALIPLRFIEVGQQIQGSESQVLGTVNQVAEIKETSGLEAPYDELENNECVTREQLDLMIDSVSEQINSGTLSEEEQSILMDNFSLSESRLCE